MRLDKFLAECSGNTRSEVKKWLKAGGYRKRRPGIKAGDEDRSREGCRCTAGKTAFLFFFCRADVSQAGRLCDSDAGSLSENGNGLH